jgi:hypothetical protein
MQFHKPLFDDFWAQTQGAMEVPIVPPNGFWQN